MKDTSRHEVVVAPEWISAVTSRFYYGKTNDILNLAISQLLYNGVSILRGTGLASQVSSNCLSFSNRL
jgi:hypothetical protein